MKRWGFIPLRCATGWQTSICSVIVHIHTRHIRLWLLSAVSNFNLSTALYRNMNMWITLAWNVPHIFFILLLSKYLSLSKFIVCPIKLYSLTKYFAQQQFTIITPSAEPRWFERLSDTSAPFSCRTQEDTELFFQNMLDIWSNCFQTKKCNASHQRWFCFNIA